MCHLVGLFGVDPVTHIQPTCYDLRKMLETLELIYIGFDVLWLCVTDHDDLSLFYTVHYEIMNTTFKSVKKQYKRNFIAGHHQEAIFLFLFLMNAECVVLFDFHLISIKVLLLKKKKKKVCTQKKLYTSYQELSLLYFSKLLGYCAN